MDEEPFTISSGGGLLRWIFFSLLLCLFVLPASTQQSLDHETLSAFIHKTQKSQEAAGPEAKELRETVFPIDNHSRSLNSGGTGKNTPPLLLALKRDALFHSIILDAARRHRVNPALVKAIIMAESGYNPKAVSSRGAMGLMQLMPRTARSLGVEDGFDPARNINGGVRYLRQLLDKFDGDVKLALAAYNAGCKKVMQYRGIPPFKTTRYYIRKVMEYYRHYQKQMEGYPDRA